MEVLQALVPLTDMTLTPLHDLKFFCSGSMPPYQASAADSLVASTRQKESPLIPFIRNVSLTFSETVKADFVVGVPEQIGIIFIALSYHRIHQERYLRFRLNEVKNMYRVRVLLCLVDVDEADRSLLDVTELAYKFNMSLFLAWSCPEAAKVLEAFKIYQHKPSDFLLPRLHHLPPLQRGIEILCTIPRITKLDAVTLLQQFGSLKAVLMASEATLLECPGIGPKKAKSIREVVDTPYF
eukprot:Blabericola_migrator_1__3044@NODE_1887_length_3605_cov_175_298191_g1209_i0_p3_GENE_NODE_1887_length_3605_cov_175_298191_g1209_i0NODE_1887_length_3605_cov_175_298191_g1209_i0_p3_ORF_typecomplete_len239_score34_11Rad10/PF03834_14/4_2e28HHH_5/PF14520_6/1_6e07HHH_2/PF12826_7/2_1e07HHH/PF00633_23/0_021HHH_3/PF12836_7/0_071muHD/PF10291_9/0_175_3_exonuc/PF01367_20/0_78RNA_pol_A_CTD/PF03118_15/0_32_NODE_1887_length_3605_cov_175_298191_g1209_i014502166